MKKEEAIKVYNDIRKYKDVFGNIDKDFFFDFADAVIDEETIWNRICIVCGNTYSEISKAPGVCPECYEKGGKNER